MGSRETTKRTRNAILLDKVCFAYGKKAVLQEVSYAVPAGSICLLLGKNGVGKTTTVKLLLGILQARSGRIEVLGCDPVEYDFPLRKRVGYVPDTPVLYDWMTVAETGRFAAAFYPDGYWPEYCRLAESFELPMNTCVRELSKGVTALVSLTAPNLNTLVLSYQSQCRTTTVTPATPVPNERAALWQLNTRQCFLPICLLYSFGLCILAGQWYFFGDALLREIVDMEQWPMGLFVLCAVWLAVLFAPGTMFSDMRFMPNVGILNRVGVSVREYWRSRHLLFLGVYTLFLVAAFGIVMICRPESFFPIAESLAGMQDWFQRKYEIFPGFAADSTLYMVCQTIFIVFVLYFPYLLMCWSSAAIKEFNIGVFCIGLWAYGGYLVYAESKWSVVGFPVVEVALTVLLWNAAYRELDHKIHYRKQTTGIPEKLVWPVVTVLSALVMLRCLRLL